MAYFYRQQDGIDRAGKVVADIFSALLILAFAIAFFGTSGGLLGFIILEGSLLAIDYVVPNDDEISGAVIR